MKRIASAVEEAAEGDAAYKSTAYVAEDLIEDMRPRLEVLEAFCHGAAIAGGVGRAAAGCRLKVVAPGAPALRRPAGTSSKN